MDKMSMEHRFLLETQKSLWPSVNTEATQLPTQWVLKEQNNRLELSSNNLRVRYTGKGQSDADAAAVRTAHPIPASCGVYYFEVLVEDKGTEGYIGIGISVGGNITNKLPGWEKNSYGYHGDDGCVFKGSGSGQVYGPTYGTGDVVGCCVNMVDGTCFYTKNGVHLGTAFSGLKGKKLYPCVGLRSCNEVVRANFGQFPFIFDIASYIAEVRSSCVANIRSMPPEEWVPALSPASSKETGACPSALNELVLEYLAHQGFSATAEVFSDQTGLKTSEDLSSVVHRQQIISLLTSGKVDKAMEFTNQMYPSVLKSNPLLAFKLKRQIFIEMVKNGANDLSNVNVLGEILQYGRQLQADCSSAEYDSEDQKKSLEEAFSLLAYRDPHTCPLSYLLQEEQREGLANELNTAILESLGLQRMSALELVLRQTEACVQTALLNDIGAAAFVSNGAML